MATKLGRMVTYLEGLPIKSSALGVAKSRDKLKPLYLHYHSAYGSQAWQDADLTYLELFPPIKLLDLLVS